MMSMLNYGSLDVQTKEPEEETIYQPKRSYIPSIVLAICLSFSLIGFIVYSSSSFKINKSISTRESGLISLNDMIDTRRDVNNHKPNHDKAISSPSKPSPQIKDQSISVDQPGVQLVDHLNDKIDNKVDVNKPMKSSKLTCINTALTSALSTYSDFSLSTSLKERAYSYSSLSVDSTIYTDIFTYRLHYDHDDYSDVNSESDLSLYLFSDVINQRHDIEHIGQINRLNQIAYLINNINTFTTATSPQTYLDTQLTGCSTITSSDIQAAIWGLVSSPGRCDDVNNLCIDTLEDVNSCNVAYIWNDVFTNQPDGRVYDYSCNGESLLIPLIAIPDLMKSKVLLLGLPSSCSCN
mmetsp:Transcript_11212/g.10136  ORF Transcript_11212/g.10136 Transcript_11212/m.10136 type:complete len:351 (+) Transcript_11212:94-1146(+)